MADVGSFVPFFNCNLYCCFLLGEFFSVLFALERPHLIFYFPTVTGLINNKKVASTVAFGTKFLVLLDEACSYIRE